jgi:hypothetical protein
MRNARRKRSLLPVVGLLAVLGLGAGCNTYSYFQIHVQLDDSFSTPRRARIHTCHVYVTGAATDDRTFGDNCSPPKTNDVGTFDFSTFADSGTVNFDLKLFEGTGEAIKLGEAMTSLAVSSGNTVKGEITVMYTGTDPMP